MTDTQLISRHAAGDEEAFADLVRRHGGWVYGVARRRVGNAHLAEDVTQAVFMVLARQGKRLRRDTILPAWLFRVTKYASAKALRSQTRRRRHETKAATMQTPPREDHAEWADLAPILDDLVGRLRQSDREAVLLRFYRQLQFAEVGAALNISEDAARKRVERAIAKLREMADAKGLTMSVGGLGALLWTNMAAEAAMPAGLVATITTAALSTSSVATLSTSTISIAKGVTTMMTLAKAKVAAAFVALTIVVGGLGTGIVTQLLAQDPPETPATNPAPAAAAEPSDPADAPLIVYGLDSGAGADALDIDRRVVLRKPRPGGDTTGMNAEQQRTHLQRVNQQVIDWSRENGIDLMVDHLDGPWHLIGIDAKLSLLSDELPAEQTPLLAMIREHLTRDFADKPEQWKTEGSFVLLQRPQELEPPVHLAYQTRDGQIGLLTIVQFNNEPRQERVAVRILPLDMHVWVKLRSDEVAAREGRFHWQIDRGSPLRLFYNEGVFVTAKGELVLRGGYGELIGVGEPAGLTELQGTFSTDSDQRAELRYRLWRSTAPVPLMASSDGNYPGGGVARGIRVNSLVTYVGREWVSLFESDLVRNGQHVGTWYFLIRVADENDNPVAEPDLAQWLKSVRN